ncbi:hypothetical protein F4553_000520 [Allocatelliglobosispora scoriae]|uniref:Uncharacterized protein n=1 Tax=Allocatelliglobosispora scoriae TaxID=643052 RepID=A0A841BJR5_9ACTN|nr:hypothetical protein [Allocatelliglobosispora scoriae]MBB5867141.1 hypothetical protein [Allocatelliglobosispora scoriae]
MSNRVQYPPPVAKTWHLNPMNPGNGHGIMPGNDVPGGKVFIPGAAPDATAAGACHWDQHELRFYRQPANPESLFDTGYTNIGAVKCGITVTWTIV